MRKGHFSEEQMVAIIREADRDPVAAVNAVPVNCEPNRIEHVRLATGGVLPSSWRFGGSFDRGGNPLSAEALEVSHACG
jgi:hypothetical protein